MSGRDAVFIDANGWIALLNVNDRLHARAVEEFRRLASARRLFVMTDWVVAETGNGLARTAARRRLAGAVRRFLASPNCRLIRVNEELFQEAIELYNRSDDKLWGLVDCASLVVMRRERIVDAFTTDLHFQQAGFRRLLTPQPR
jgi:predicted nucleic acid-binding protein